MPPVHGLSSAGSCSNTTLIGVATRGCSRRAWPLIAGLGTSEIPLRHCLPRWYTGDVAALPLSSTTCVAPVKVAGVHPVSDDYSGLIELPGLIELAGLI